jgi:DNA-binding NtrC family response regulator
MVDEDPRGRTEVGVGLPPRVASGLPRLVAVAGPAAGRALALSTARATVGRHPTNDLVLPDPRVSGVHLELRRQDNRIVVRDAGSTNGTWLGAHRIVEMELAEGAQIVVGSTTLRVEWDDAASAAAASTRTSFGNLVGTSLVMRELFATLERVAPKALSVLIQGETGTGKEEVARALHAHSPRASRPFVVIDATALPESLVESLLFGHEKGAFTGADRRRPGLFEAATGGTVFIDEIGELAPSLQAKFLRVLERFEVVRVGGHGPIPVDVRVITATHRDLRHEIEAGRFREDLYFRLSQVRVVVPPLRDRLEDIAFLHRSLLESMKIERPPVFETDALEFLAAQPWPGNVRELRNVLSRAVALAHDGTVRRSDLAGEGLGFRGTRLEREALDLSGTFAEAKERATERFEAAYLHGLMSRSKGNLSLASRSADLARNHLRELLKKRGLYGLSWPEDLPSEDD